VAKDRKAATRKVAANTRGCLSTGLWRDRVWDG